MINTQWTSDPLVQSLIAELLILCFVIVFSGILVMFAVDIILALMGLFKRRP